jgi:predicted AlkP superfamily phosphohydrolase/phosphomutase
LAPNTDSDFTYPKALKTELREAVGEYIIDVKDYRTDDKDRLIKQIHAMLDNRFAYARYLMDNKPWDFFMMVEMGVDRLHHGLWKHIDPTHPKFEPGNPYENSLREYYRAVDDHIGELLKRVGDETAVFIVSDHGAKPMMGGVCINQWLINEGLLTVRDKLDGRKRIEDCDIDWSRTKAWSSGGYYARLFLNVQGREPQGIIPPAEYEAVRDDIVRRLETMNDHQGKPLNTKAHKPEDLYRTVNGVAPDLIIYFGDLFWRSVGSVGFDSIYTFENDTGPDEANHDYNGIFVMDDRTGRNGKEMSGLQLMDIAPTILDVLGIEPPADMQGKVIN